jgi:fumarate hydratase class II
MEKDAFRIEKDSMGEIEVPDHAYWGAQTQRAMENFPISGIGFPPSFIRALGMVKCVAAETNLELDLLEKNIAKAIIQAATEVMEGILDDQFVLDIFQTGSGTSTNMNTNEVIANRANEILVGKRGSKTPVHPNDHVNKGQSSNDVIPTCIHISALNSIKKELLPSLEILTTALDKKSKEFHDIIKIGRTHYQDATPLSLGQEFGGYATMVEHGIVCLENCFRHLEDLAIGGTAVGTGINTHPEFPGRVIKKINKITGLSFREAQDHFEAQGSKGAIVETSGALKTVASSLMKIANDIRFLSSGPHCGIGEIILPTVQPGSSIMPGKVNPVIAEAVCMVSAQVIGNDTTITVAGLSGNLELNVMMPVIAHNLLESIRLLSNASKVFAEKCIIGITANRSRIEKILEQSLAMATALTPEIGYDAAAAIAKKAYQSGKTVREIAEEENVLPKEKLDKILDPKTMVKPQ